jgi:type I restriction enzyme S subunit
MPSATRHFNGRSATIVALGEVVEIITKYWDRDTAVPERLVAGEHIDEGDLRVRRWGMTDDDLVPPTFNRWFQSGDVLLHSRNIKKIARPDFRGITGEKLFILRSKSESVLLQELLPFILQSAAFQVYAESRWAGSTNKFLNKGPLEEFEFALPPIEEQQRMAQALTEASAACDATEALRAAVDQLHRAAADRVAISAHQHVSLGEIITETAYGSSQRACDNGVVPILGIPNVKRGILDLSECNRVTMKPEELLRYGVSRGDLLIVRTNGNPDYVGRAVVVGDLPGSFVYASYLIRVRCDERRVIPDFLGAMLNTTSVRKAIRAVVRSSAGNYNLNSTEIRALSVPLPERAAQSDALLQLAAIEQRCREALVRLTSLRALRKTILAACFR